MTRGSNILGLGLNLSVSIYRVGVAMSIAVVSGLVSGIVPALKAANMPPVDAMRST